MRDARPPVAALGERCTTCVALLLEASGLARRAQRIDADVEQARKVGKGCATPALAILNTYDRELEQWQARVTQHLHGGSHPELPYAQRAAGDQPGQPS